MANPRPGEAKSRRFTAKQRRELQKGEGLTDAQVLYLERALNNVAFELQRSPAVNDVRDKLADLHKHLAAADKACKKLVAAARPNAGAEARGHLGIAAGQVGWTRLKRALLDVLQADAAELGGRELGSTPDGFGATAQDVLLNDTIPPGADLIQLAAVVVAHALNAAPRRRRSASVAPPRAIEFIDEAIQRPTDDASRAAAERLRVSRSPSKPGKPSFSNVARIVFDAARGEEGVTPDRAIRAYLSQDREHH